MNEITPFSFDGRKVRVVVREGEPWFVASDVAKILGFATAKDAARMLDADEKGGHKVPTVGRGAQTLTIVSLPGLFSLLVRSRVPEAKPFRRWVTHVVLPAIHKTGRYEFHPTDLEVIGIEISLLNHDVQRDHSKRLAASLGSKARIIDNRTGLCIAVTGQHPKEVREQGLALGFRKRQRESAPQVLRTMNDIRAAVYAGLALMVASGTPLARAAELKGRLEDDLSGVRQTLRAGGVDPDGLARLPKAEVEALLRDHEARRKALDRQLVLDLFGGEPV